MASTSRPLRVRVLADLKAILSSPTPARSKKHDKTAQAEVEKAFKTFRIVRSLGEKLARKAVARHAVEVGFEKGCLGVDAGSITVTVDNVLAGACVTVSTQQWPHRRRSLRGIFDIRGFNGNSVVLPVSPPAKQGLSSQFAGRAAEGIR